MNRYVLGLKIFYSGILYIIESFATFRNKYQKSNKKFKLLSRKLKQPSYEPKRLKRIFTRKKRKQKIMMRTNLMTNWLKLTEKLKSKLT